MDNLFNKSDVLFITADNNYVNRGLVASGYQVELPYRYKTIIGRMMLEIAVKLRLSHKFLFNRKILQFKGKYIIVFDGIITKQFLLWLKKIHPDKKIIFEYTNLVGKARHLLPENIPSGIEICTYDANDSKKYNLYLIRSGGYCPTFISQKRDEEYDIVFVGRDKGRAEYIFELEKQFKSMGLKTKFLVMPSTRLNKRKKGFSKVIEYEEVIELVAKSKSILNITLPNQVGATMRDYESIFNEVKLITTNTNIVNFDFYNKNNIFILGIDDLNKLKEFIVSPYEHLPEELLNKYLIDSQVSEIIQNI